MPVSSGSPVDAEVLSVLHYVPGERFRVSKLPVADRKPGELLGKNCAYRGAFEHD
jgi:hypothetical protein